MSKGTLPKLEKRGPCIIGGEYPDIRFSTQQEKKLNKDKAGGNSQPSKHQEKKDNTKLCIIFLFYI